jgi:hypothetical protein
MPMALKSNSILVINAAISLSTCKREDMYVVPQSKIITKREAKKLPIALLFPSKATAMASKPREGSTLGWMDALLPR